MNILIINASPRRQGSIARMLDEMQRVFTESGHTVEYVRTDELHVAHCKGCMHCRKAQECVLPEDDAQRTLERLRRCDLLVVGAPCYWGNMPGELKILFDRIVYGLIGEGRYGMPTPLHKGKRAIIISTCSWPYPLNIIMHQTRGTVRALKEIFKWSGFKIVGIIERGGTNAKPLTERDLRKCRKLAERV